MPLPLKLNLLRFSLELPVNDSGDIDAAGKRIKGVETVHVIGPIHLLYKANVFEIVLADIRCTVSSYDTHCMSSDLSIMSVMIPPAKLFSFNAPQFQKFEM